MSLRLMSGRKSASCLSPIFIKKGSIHIAPAFSSAAALQQTSKAAAFSFVLRRFRWVHICKAFPVAGKGGFFKELEHFLDVSTFFIIIELSIFPAPPNTQLPAGAKESHCRHHQEKDVENNRITCHSERGHQNGTNGTFCMCIGYKYSISHFVLYAK